MANARRRSHADRVLKHLRQQHGPRSAYQILSALRPEGIAAPMTVYRALSQLEAAGRVRRVVSLNAWAAASEPTEGTALAILICTTCGTLAECRDLLLEGGVSSLSAAAGFAADKALIEIHGRCAACMAAPSAA